MSAPLLIKGIICLSGASVLAALIALSAPPAHAAADQPFSLSKAERREQEQDQAAEEERAKQVQGLVSIPCQRRLKNRKILQLVGEYSSSQWFTDQGQFSSFFGVIDARLRALGLTTYTQEEIRRQIAGAEVDAYFKNDPDAALAAAKRFGAQYILRGEINTRGAVNAVVGVNQVAVDIQLTLTRANGQMLSRAESHGTSYAGQDVIAAATALVREQADQLVGQLYNDYCRQGVAP